MKKILVAIDFSECSINALEHALTLADKAGADIRMVWASKPESLKEVFEVIPENVEEAVGNKFKELVDKYKAGLDKNKIDYKIRKGKIYKEVVNEAEEWKADIIITGTHGASGFEEFWIGSNANKIVTATKLPTITIRGGVDIERDLNKIVLPIDSSIETRQKATITARLAHYFDAEIHVLALHTTSVAAIKLRVQQYAQQVKKFFDDEEIKNQYVELDADNITRSTIDYAVKNEANLISIMTEQEKSPSNLWLGPYAAQMVNHSPIPVLSIHSEATDFQSRS